MTELPMTEVKIKSISITDIGFVVFLKGKDQEKALPIFIGPVEAQAISMILMNNKPKRPMTHDLIKQIFELTDYSVVKVEVTDIRNETFFSNLYLQKKSFFKRSSNKNMICVDSRPSDAIALALRFDAPIYCSTELLEEHGIELEEEKEKDAKDVQGKPEYTEHPTINKKVNEELGAYRKMLDVAIKEERFEDAAKIRNKIDALMGLNN